MPNYKNKITPQKAVEKAMDIAHSDLGKNIDSGKTLNCGDDDDYIYTDEEQSLNTAWMKQKFSHNGVDYTPRKINASSGDVKFDLRFAEGTDKSVFNYHVPFKKDTRAEEAAAKQSAEDKKIAAAHKLELEREKKEKEEADKKAKEQKKLDDARQKKLADAANTAWNAFKKTKGWNKSIVEKTWKEQWIEDNEKRIK
jgi:hypothetical protein